MVVLYQNNTNNNSTRPKLVLIDHDGTLCQTNNNAYDSIIYAIKDAAQFYGADTKQLESDWDSIFSSTTGSSEKYLAKVVFYKLNLKRDQLEDFSQRMYQSRANWYSNMKSHGEFIQDTYYPDALQLIENISESSNYYLMMVTGNPKKVIKQRLASSLKHYFSDGVNTILGVFGEDAESRQDLIIKAVETAENYFPDFKSEQNEEDFFENVYYIGDSRADFFAGMKAKVKTVWVPSRTLQTYKQIISEDSISFLADYFTNRVCISNILDNKRVYDFLGLEKSERD